jgi:hypothetical protein
VKPRRWTTKPTLLTFAAKLNLTPASETVRVVCFGEVLKMAALIILLPLAAIGLGFLLGHHLFSDASYEEWKRKKAEREGRRPT